MTNITIDLIRGTLRRYKHNEWDPAAAYGCMAAVALHDMGISEARVGIFQWSDKQRVHSVPDWYVDYIEDLMDNWIDEDGMVSSRTALDVLSNYSDDEEYDNDNQ